MIRPSPLSTKTPKRADVVLVLFPNSDLRTAKMRPALIVQADGLNTGLPQLVVSMISSRTMRANHASRVRYPEKLRRIRYVDAQKNQRLVFLTNNFTLPPLTIAQLYRSRWQVELFFKWIKQHLRIKNFYGTSENALRTQIWIAISVYVLVAIVKKELHLEGSLYRMLQICSVTLFEKTPILQALSLADDQTTLDDLCKQLILFN